MDACSMARYNSQRQSHFATEIGNLNAKKRQKRSTALNYINERLYNDFSSLSLSGLEETLKEGLKLALKGTEEEKVAALKAIIGLSIFKGSNSSSLVSFFTPILLPFFSPSVPSHLFSLALDAETTLLFVSRKRKETEDFLEFLYEYLDQTVDDHFTSHLILRSYSLLLSRLPSSKISKYYLPFHLRKICEITRKTEETQLLLTAGETISLVLSSHRDFIKENEGKEWELEELDQFIPLTEFLDEQNQNCYLHKIFKSIIENKLPNKAPTKVNSTIIKLNDWPRMIQMRFFKEILQGSLNLHLNVNDLFAEIFGYDMSHPKPKMQRFEFAGELVGFQPLDELNDMPDINY